jgi:MFS family permease
MPPAVLPSSGSPPQAPSHHSEDAENTNSSTAEHSPYPAYSLVFADFLGLGTIMPLLPFFVQDFDNSIVWLGAIMSGQAFGVVLGILLMGVLSDRHGRKQMGTVAMFGDCVMFFLSGFMKTPQSLLICRFVAGLFCPIPVAMSWLIDISPSSDPELRTKRVGKATGFIMAGMFCGFVVSGILGQFAGWTVALMGPAVIAAAVGFYVFFFARAPPKANSLSKPSPGPVTRTRRWRCVFLVMVGIGCCTGHYTAVPMSMFVNKHDMSPAAIAGFNGACILLMIISNVFIFPWSMRVLGATKMLSLYCSLGGIALGTAYFSEGNLAVFFLHTMPGEHSRTRLYTSSFFVINSLRLPTYQPTKQRHQ